MLAFLACGAVFTVDAPLARYEILTVPGDLRRLLVFTEVFAHGMGVAMIVIIIWVMDHNRRLFVPRIVMLTFMPGIAANIIKMLVKRRRPNDFGEWDSAPRTFEGFPGSSTDWELQSFPSGHTATAVGLAIALCMLYPRGRGVFIALAALSAAQRIFFDAHFASDTLAAASLACFVNAPLVDRLLWDVPDLRGE